MKVIVFTSTKGGVTKTTSAVQTAAYLGIVRNAATLLMDFDSQGQVALWFGHDSASDVFDWWTGVKSLENSVVAAREEGQLWLLRGNSRTKIIEKMYREISAEKYGQFVRWIRELEGHFEYVVIDTPPTGIMQEVAIGAADFIVVPFKTEVPGVDGADGALAMLKAMKHKAEIVLLPADHFARVREQKRCLVEFATRIGAHMMAPRPVLHRTAVTEAVAEGKTIWEYQGDGIEPVRLAYKLLCERLVGLPDDTEPIHETEEMTHESY